MNKNNRQTLVWDNIPEWAIFRIGVRHRGRIVPAERGLGNDKPVHRREFPEWLHDERGLGIMHGIRPTSGIRKTVQDLQGDFCNKLNILP